MATKIKGKAKKFLKVSLCIVLIVVIARVGLYFLCDYLRDSSRFTDEQHMARVEKFVIERYMSGDFEFTDYELYPVYTEADELMYFVLDFAPQGYVYIKIRSRYMLIYGASAMYCRSSNPYEGGWNSYFYDDNGNTINYTDINKEEIIYYNSHFYEAGIEGETRYLLEVTNAGSSTSYLVPAVKRGDLYLNLVSMELFEYQPIVDEPLEYASLAFVNKSYFSL